MKTINETQKKLSYNEDAKYQLVIPIFNNKEGTFGSDIIYLIDKDDNREYFVPKNNSYENNNYFKRHLTLKNADKLYGAEFIKLKDEILSNTYEVFFMNRVVSINLIEAVGLILKNSYDYDCIIMEELESFKVIDTTKNLKLQKFAQITIHLDNLIESVLDISNDSNINHLKYIYSNEDDLKNIKIKPILNTINNIVESYPFLVKLSKNYSLCLNLLNLLSMRVTHATTKEETYGTK